MADPKEETKAQEEPKAKEESSVEQGKPEEEEEEYSSSDYDSSDSEYTTDAEDDEEEVQDAEKGKQEQKKEVELTKEERLAKARDELNRRMEEEKAEEEELWNFPPDKEHWTEKDLDEHWEDYWGNTKAVGWDPMFVSNESWKKYQQLWKEGKPGPPKTLYYVPYRKFYPSIPDNHFDIQTPEDVVEELERTEEFLVWMSYLFKDGSAYEGTVWDDLAHGKGVYTTPFDLVRYEGEWQQNMMQGHGVLEVDLPVDEPIPDTKAWAKAKAKGQILRSDYMDPFDREWLKMDAKELFEDHGQKVRPWEEKDAWVKLFGSKPEKGHYKYAGQFKHSRFHGCGMYEVNARPVWGKFYFGEILPDPEECTPDNVAIHASLGEIAAAKARMFVNKPDGMVRQVRGPFTDPSHPYMYEEEDLWMAPGFIHSYYEVPEEWKVYVEDLDKEREMWLNSFYRSPFTVPMPPELEYVWSQDEEFILLGNTLSASLQLNPENIERAKPELQGEVLLHVPTGRIINWAEDSKGRLRFFFQPITENGEVDTEGIIPIPDGFDDYFPEDKEAAEKAAKKKNIFQVVKAAWDKSREEAQKKRERRKQELQERWEQEDEVREYQSKLRRAERYLSYQIEKEKIVAERHSKEADVQGQADETDEEQPPDEAPVEAPDVGAQDGKEVEEEKGAQEEVEEEKGGQEDREEDAEDEKKASEQDQEEEEDDEDDKKPKSFGRVAMVGIEDGPHRTEGSKQRCCIFPTAFASLSLEPKMVAGEALKAKVGQMVADFFFWRGNDGTKAAQLGNGMRATQLSKKRSNYPLVKLLCTPRDVQMATTAAAIVMHQQQYLIRGYHRQRGGVTTTNGCRWPRRKHPRPAHHPDTAIWSKPELEFLSLAVPVKQ